MEDTVKNELLNYAYKTFTEKEGDTAIRAVFERFGRALDLDALLTFRTSETPFLLETDNVWDASVNLGDRRLVMDYRDNENWFKVNPYNEETRVYRVDDTSDEDLETMSREMVETAGVTAFVSCAMSSGRDYVGELVFAYRRGPREWKESEISLMRELAKILYTIVAREKRNEARRFILAEAENMVSEAGNATSQFLTNISHELRVPINSITGMSTILRHNIDNPEIASQCLDRLDKAVRQLLDSMSSCVDSALINGDRLLVDMSWFKPSDLEEDVRKVYGPLCEVKRQILEFEYESGMIIYSDITKILRIIGHLISNASKYSDEGGRIKVSISIDENARTRGMIMFRVRDNGCGMDEETRRFILEPYNPNRLNKGAPQGLGTFIAKHLIRLMHGTMDVYSQIGGGTEFVFMIPARINVDKPVAIASEEEEEKGVSEIYIGRRILIAEDNVLMGEILATILGYRGLASENAINGREALDMYLSHEPFYYDMIFMDIQMPVMDGIEATRRIRESNKADAQIIPIIALSANTSLDDMERSTKGGMNSQLLKPVGEKELFETISQYLI
ncbi:MAG: hybrid sensor histidine kinase/response regulator [Lachnospiraceae bacterium]|nr:hybrid sensor histidine kinase/response regulator [Lachnospiraceae bacterium]